MKRVKKLIKPLLLATMLVSLAGCKDKEVSYYDFMEANNKALSSFVENYGVFETYQDFTLTVTNEYTLEDTQELSYKQDENAELQDHQVTDVSYEKTKKTISRKGSGLTTIVEFRFEKEIKREDSSVNADLLLEKEVITSKEEQVISIGTLSYMEGSFIMESYKSTENGEEKETRNEYAIFSNNEAIQSALEEITESLFSSYVDLFSATPEMLEFGGVVTNISKKGKQYSLQLSINEFESSIADKSVSYSMADYKFVIDSNRLSSYDMNYSSVNNTIGLSENKSEASSKAVFSYKSNIENPIMVGTEISNTSTILERLTDEL